MKKVNYQLIIVVSLISIFIYGPFIYEGGFGPQDDLIYVNHALGKSNIIELTIERLTSGIDYVASREVAARPIGMLGLTIANVLFQDNPTPYIIVQIILWTLTIINLSYTVKHTVGNRVAMMFILLGQFPTFASTITFSSFRFGEYGLSIFFWTLSLVFQRKYVINRRIHDYLIAYFLLTLGLFSLSIILPLLIMSALLPIVYENNINNNLISKSNILKYGWKYIFPVVLVGSLFLIYKIYGIKLFNVDSIPKGLEAGISLKSLIKFGYYFVVIFLEIPLMLLAVIPHLLNWDIAVIMILVLLFLYLIGNWEGRYLFESNEKIEINFINLVKLTLGFASVIFLISGYPSVTFGGYNRMLIPSFLLFTVIASYYLCRTLNTNLKYVSLIIIFLWISSMNIQISNFIESWQIREYVYNDWSNKMKKTNLGEKPYVLACVPFFTSNNYNNEEVFLTHFYKAGLKIYGINEVNGEVICWRSISRNDNYMTVLNFSDKFIASKNMWYYEYDIKTQKSKLKKIKDQKELDNKLEEITANNINRHPIIYREKILMHLRSLVL
ncbi:MAG: hypothetical protein CMG71_01350 [Candidatus Marinimicrobia bacterium]|nr:hypothetical protein [Candidatus Neomarinimicrobiota bacterium]|tara:strand:- start:144 stop:1808 length:1665 start_codon:yes stop_codon:yes gene_type:complete